MSLRYVLFRENSNSHDEEYLAREDHNSFVSVATPGESNLQFESAAEGYEFAKEFAQLQYWRVGRR